MVHMTLADTFEFQAARSMKQTHQLKFSNVDDVVIVWMPEDLFELLSIVQTGEELTKYIDHSKPKKLVISFDHVRSFGSQAVGDLIKVTKRVRAYGGDVKLCSMSTRIREVFDICRLIGPVFELYQSTSEAVEAFGNKPKK